MGSVGAAHPVVLAPIVIFKHFFLCVGVVVCLERRADCLHMVPLMPLHLKTPSSLAPIKSRLVSPFWYRLTQVVLEKRPLNGCKWL